ncbi:MAG: glycosyltransferase [Planctomycetota bacterium]
MPTPSRQLHIVHVLDTLDPATGGVVAHATDLAILMARLGHRVTFVTAHTEPRPRGLDAESGIELASVGAMGRTGRVLRKAQIADVLEHARAADVVHLHGCWMPYNDQVARGLRRMGKPYVFTPHGMLDDWCMKQGGLKKRVYHALFGARLIAGAQRILYCASAEQQQSERWVGGVPGQVIPAAMDLSDYVSLPGPERARAEVEGADTADPIVLFLSRIDPKKGLETLLEAMAVLAARETAATLLVAGSGEPGYVAELERSAETLGIAGRVRFVGPVRDAKKVSLYQRADVLALATHQENFGLVLTESLAAETPVITTRGVDIWPDIVEHDAGLIVDRTAEAFADAIEEVISNPERAAQMGRNGRAWVFEAFTSDVLGPAFASMYAEVVGKAD